MKTISKKLFSLLLVVIMVASVIPFQAFADTPKCPVHPANTLEYQAAVKETCTTDGSVVHFSCPDCDAGGIFYLVDGDGNVTPTNADGIKIAAHHTDGDAVSAKAATCTEDGNKAYVKCADCGARKVDGVWTKDKTKSEIPALGHSTTSPVTAPQGGNAESCWYTVCEREGCSQAFAVAADKTVGAAATAPVAHTMVDNVCTVCGYKAPPAPQGDTQGYTVVIRLKGANGAEIKSEVLTPETSSAFVDIGETDTVNFRVEGYFPQTDSHGKALLTNDKTVYSVKRGEVKIIEVDTYYETADMTELTVVFKTTDKGRFVSSKSDTYSVTVKRGSGIPAAPAVENRYTGFNFTNLWATKEGASVSEKFDYLNASTSELTGTLYLYAIYDAVADTKSSLNICFYGSKVTSTTKTLSGLSSDATIDSILSKIALEDWIDTYGFGFELASTNLYKNTSGTTYAAGTTVADVNQANGTVYIHVKPLSYTATFLALDGTVNAVIANATSKEIKDLLYGQTNIEMPIPVATGNGNKNYTFYGWREKTSGNIYKFVDNTKMLLTYNYNRNTVFEPVWNTSSGVYVNIYFNNITNRSLYTVQIHDLEAGDTLTVNTVLNLLNKYFTWTSYRGLYTNAEWNEAVRNNFTTSSGTKSVDGMPITTADRQEFNLMLLGAKQNGMTITNANLSTIGIGVNKDGAYAPADPSNPKTGNEAQMLGVAMASMVMAVITLGGVTYYTRKKEEMI